MSGSFNSEDIKFPCEWHGSLIMQCDATGVESSVRGIYAALSLPESQILPGRVSGNGSYVTWKLSSVVPDLDTLRELFHRLESLPGERMLI